MILQLAIRPFKVGLFIFFICIVSSGEAQTISSAEYFFDTDPGPGNGTPLSLTPGDPVTFMDVISTTGLEPGYHLLFVRTRTSAGVWSLYEAQEFIIDAGITAAEYFFDTDPGVGNGMALPIAPFSNTLTPTISTVGLIDGVHYLFIRTRHDDGVWSLSDPQVFIIRTRIVEAEYFIDTDPGLGNGTPLTISTPTDLITITPTIVTPSLPDGDHYLFIRTKDILGKWSHFEPQLFTVDASLPIELFDFTAKATRDGRVKLQWTTVTETNNDYFTVEHAGSGIEFNEIFQVPGAGTSVRIIDYERIHDYPLPGINYYRLKQTDFGGSYSYSKIVSADVTLRPIIVYPNPITDKWFIEFPAIQDLYTVEIFDLSGRKIFELISQGEGVVELDRQGFLNGSYVLRIGSQGLPNKYFKLNFR